MEASEEEREPGSLASSKTEHMEVAGGGGGRGKCACVHTQGKIGSRGETQL